MTFDKIVYTTYVTERNGPKLLNALRVFNFRDKHSKGLIHGTRETRIVKRVFHNIPALFEEDCMKSIRTRRFKISYGLESFPSFNNGNQHEGLGKKWSQNLD